LKKNHSQKNPQAHFNEHDPGRRQIVCLLGAVAFTAPQISLAHGEMGPVEPRVLAPATPLVLHDGRQTDLRRVLLGHWTALQLMFTGCSALCPIQGAVFSSLQNEAVMNRFPKAQLLSISIDPLSDTPAALAAWLKRFDAQATWLAASPPVAWVDRLLDFVKGRTPLNKNADRHTAQVYVFDPNARLASRLAELADPADIAKVMSAMVDST
jgi:protein SCO1